MSTQTNVRTELSNLVKVATSGILKVTDNGVSIVANNQTAAAKVIKILDTSKVGFGAAKLRNMEGKQTWFIPVDFPKEFKAVKEFTVIEKAASAGANVMDYVDFHEIMFSEAMRLRMKAEYDAQGLPQLSIKDDDGKWKRQTPKTLGWKSSQNDHMTPTHSRTILYRVVLALYATGGLTEKDLTDEGAKVNEQRAKAAGKAATPKKVAPTATAKPVAKK